MGLYISWCKRIFCLYFILRSISIVRNTLAKFEKKKIAKMF